MAGSALTTGLAAGIGSSAFGKASNAIQQDVKLLSMLGDAYDATDKDIAKYGITDDRVKTQMYMAAEKLSISNEKLNKSTKEINNSTENLSKTTSTKMIPSWAKLLAILYVVQRVIKSVYSSYAEAIDAETKLSGVLKATGYTAGYTTDQLKLYASELQGLTTYGDDVITNTMAVLASFRNIRGDVFKDATESILDMATVMGTDAASAALQLGKALNDPIDGISALTRVGVSFTDEQKKQIENFIKMGDVASAQQIILKEIQKEFGGVSKEMAKTDVGKIKQMANVWDDLKEKVGKFVVTLMEKWGPMITWMMEGLSWLADGINKIFGFEMATNLKDAQKQLEEYTIDVVKLKNTLKSMEDAMGYGIYTNPSTGAPQLAAKIEDYEERISKIKDYISKLDAEQTGIELGKQTPYSVDTSADAAKSLDNIRQMELDIIKFHEGNRSYELAQIKDWYDEQTKLYATNASALNKIEELRGIKEYEIKQKGVEDEKALQAEIFNIKSGGKDAELAELTKTYTEQLELYKGHEEALLKVKELYKLKKEKILVDNFMDEYDKAVEFNNRVREIEVETLRLKGDDRSADLVELQAWYDEQLDMLKGNKEAEAKLRKLYDAKVKDTEPLQKWMREAEQMKVTGADVAESVGSNMSSAFSGILDGTTSLKEGFRGMATSILKDLSAMIIKMLVYKAIVTSLQYMGYADGGITPPANSMPGAANGNVFSGPKSGYPVMMHGNEAVIPLKNGKVPVDLNNNSGGATTVINNITVESNAKSGSAEAEQLGSQISRIVENKVLEVLYNNNRARGPIKRMNQGAI
ncbi:MAG: phage tail length tape measure family protein [Methanogenium sp.]|jgi:hypothetical protein